MGDPVHARGASFRPWIKFDVPIMSYGIENHNIVEHTDALIEANPMVRKLLEIWNKLYNEPFRGITNEG